MRDSFIFYKSFYEAIKDLPRDVQGEVYTAIMEYSFNGITTGQLKPIARSIFTLMKPQLDANRARYENGSKGGRPKKETEQKPNDNLDETKSEPNKNDNVNDNHNANDNDNKNDLLLEKEAKDALIENSNQGPVKADDSEKEKSSAKKEKEFGRNEFKARLISQGVDPLHAEDWMKIRRDKKLGFTETALRAIEDDCIKNGIALPEAIQFAAERSWGGFRYIWWQTEQKEAGLSQSPESQPAFSSKSQNNYSELQKAKLINGSLAKDK